MRVGVRTFRKDKYKNSKQLPSALNIAMDNVVKPHYIGVFNAFVSGWRSVSHFEARKRIFSDNSIHLYVFPKGTHKEVWYCVDRGTPPHTITAVNAPFLTFPNAVYLPRTKPVAQTGGLGGYFGIPSTVSVVEVDHPGIDPRLFTETATKDMDNRRVFMNAVSNAIVTTFK